MNEVAKHEDALLSMRELSFDEAQRDPTLLYSSRLPGESSTDTARSYVKRSNSRRRKGPKSAVQVDEEKEQARREDTSKHEEKKARSSKISSSNNVKSQRRSREEGEKSDAKEIQASKKYSEEEKREHARLLKDREAFDQAVKRAQMILFLEKKAQSERKLFTSSPAIDENKSVQGASDPMTLLGRQVEKLWTSTRPSPAQVSGRALLIKDVQLALDRRWPGFQLRVEPFGSTLTGMLEATSDVDLCLIDPVRPHGVGTPAEQVLPFSSGVSAKPLHNQYIVGIAGVPDYYSVKLIARALEHILLRNVFRHVLPIAHANVPIVKFDHCQTGLSCDINVNDTFGLRNSEMIRAYLNVAPAITEPFVFCVKKWASRRGINDPSGQSGTVTLNSYTVVLIALQYLQVRGILPNLQDPALIETVHAPTQHVWQRPKGRASSRADSEREDDTQESEKLDIPLDSSTGARWFNTTFADLSDPSLAGKGLEIAEQNSSLAVSGVRFQQINSSSMSVESVNTVLGELLRDFFGWLYDFAYDDCAFSLRQGQPVRRRQRNEEGTAERIAHYALLPAYDARWTTQPILCQDPFIVDRNTCGAVTEVGFNVIMDEIKRAKDLLLDVDATTAVALLSDLLADGELESLQAYHDDQLQQFSAAKQQEIYRLAATRGARKSKISLPARSKKRRKRRANKTTTASTLARESRN